MAEDLKLLNHFADPPIEVRASWSGAYGTLAQNRYFDPEDGVQFDDTDLTPIDKGHVYYHSEIGLPTANGTVLFFCPLRVVDYETYNLVNQYKAFLQAELPRWGDGDYRRTAAADRDGRVSITHAKNLFLVPAEKAAACISAMIKRGWHVEAGLVPDWLTRQLRDLVAAFDRASVEFFAGYNKVLSLTAQNSTISEVAAAMAELTTAQRAYDAASPGHGPAGITVQTISHYNVRQWHGAGEITALAQFTGPSVPTPNSAEAERHAQDVITVLKGQELNAALKRPLGTELGRVTMYYPIARILSSNIDNELVMDLGCAKVTYDGSTYKVEGDLQALVRQAHVSAADELSPGLIALAKVRKLGG